MRRTFLCLLTIFVFGGFSVAVGDQVDVIGVVQEYYDLTEISGPVTVSVDTTGNPLPSAGVIDSTLPSAFPADPPELERFEASDWAIVLGR